MSDRLQRRRRRRKRGEELFVARRWYREARRAGERPRDALLTAQMRTLKRCYFPHVRAMFDQESSILARLR